MAAAGRSKPRPRVRAAGLSGGAPELHLAFWTQFASFLESERRPVRILAPARQSLAAVPRGPGRFRLAPWNAVSGISGVWVRWDGRDAEGVLDAIELSGRQALGEQLSRLGKVVWLPRDRQGSLLSLRRRSEVTDPDTWPELSAWLADAVETLGRLLAAYVPD